jgi:hypothetical protein
MPFPADTYHDANRRCGLSVGVNKEKSTYNYHAYFAPLVTLPIIIDGPRSYITRCGDVVSITASSAKNDFGCIGAYQDGVKERWHRSGRINASRETSNDVIRRA